MWRTCGDLQWCTVLAGAGVILCCRPHCDEPAALELV